MLRVFSDDEEDLGVEWVDEVVAAAVMVAGGDGDEEEDDGGQEARSHRVHSGRSYTAPSPPF